MSAHSFALLACVASTALGIVGLRSGDGGRNPLPCQVISCVAGRYDTSSPGRRLAAHLWRAQINLSPSAWRCAQLFMTFPAATVLVALGANGPTVPLLAFSIVRSGSRALLWIRRHALRHALDAAAATIGRALATELAAWGSGSAAIAAGSRRCRSCPVAARVLDLAAARVAFGGDPATSLRRALKQVEPRLRDTSPTLTVAAIFALHHADASAIATSLDRLAAALDDDRAVRREAHAAMGEVRMSAIAVPVIAAVTAAMMLSADPPALAAALSWPLFPLLIGAVVVVVAASLAARRLIAL